MQLGLYLSPALLLANTVCSDTHTLAQSPVIGSFALCRPSTPFPFFVNRALGSDKVHTDQLLSALPQTRMHSVCVCFLRTLQQVQRVKEKEEEIKMCVIKKL